MHAPSPREAAEDGADAVRGVEEGGVGGEMAEGEGEAECGVEFVRGAACDAEEVEAVATLTAVAFGGVERDR